VKNTTGTVAGEGDKHTGRHDRQRKVHRRRSGGSSGRIALILAIVGLVLIVVFVVPRGQQKSAEPLKRAGFTTGIPINDADPTSNKPIVSGISSTYKGYTVGHCCAVSKQDWEALSVERKEAFIRGFMR
jgi:hypothetical protein